MTDQSDNTAPPAASVTIEVTTCRGTDTDRRTDVVTTEEPLEIRVVSEVRGRQEPLSVAVTMRTPGNDYELAKGFLVSEGVIDRQEQVWRVGYCESAQPSAEQNIVEVVLRPGVEVDPRSLVRSVITSSSCGICGKTSIDAVEAICPSPPVGDFVIDKSILHTLPETLATQQPVFAKTGGLHAAALFDSQGNLQVRREDVGRHNAVDKLVGSLLDAGALPASDSVLLVSGRVSFELVQKALLAGIPFLAAVGAPSSLAIALAERYGATLVGFLREGRFNVYSGIDRVGGCRP